ncbi:MAG: VOC family protein [Actinomycetia bacterium]|nr:VOC family protein [Actinomycetes bacterium]
MEFTIHPELPAIDIQRARAWYKEKLGLDPVTVGGDPLDPEAEPSDSELLYDTGTATFGVYESPHAGKNLATAARLVASDFDAAHAELVANGVVFEEYDIEQFSEENGTPYFRNGVLISPDGEKTAWFKDSEGNILAIGSA